jgi:protease-4
MDDLKRFREDDAIKAIVVRIDSPGGAVGPSQEIYREMQKTVENKTVVASMGAVAASGGYYVAAGADKIMANPGTITGSIGVIMGFANYQALLEKIGLVPVVVKSGEYKDMGSPTRRMTDSERKIFQELTGKIHDQFVSDIATGRGMAVDRVATLADGRIFTGSESKAMGLVDRLGNFEDAVQWAGDLGGIQGEVRTVFAKDQHLSFLDYLLMHTRWEAVIHRLLTPGPRPEAILDPSRG